ncbi:MAG: hypothetical protein LBU21_08185 [Treponema sp.]|jgi:hypothetical protein|nr:hypothetical protein [Treponema sp.]
MDKNLIEALSGRPDNYILPFLWMHDGNTDRLKDQVRQVYDSGVRAFCVESRPHEQFGKELWWTDMEIILEEAESLGMKVWVLDDKHFPTGYANGLITEKYPGRGKWQLVERHVDAAGPAPGSSLLMPKPRPWLPELRELSTQDRIIGVFAYPRNSEGETVAFEPVDLSGKISGDFLYWDVPAGFWRIFFFIKSRSGTGQSDYIHLIDKASVDVQIEGVYEAHYQKLKKYFGTTLAGFFSDEPSLGNEYFDPSSGSTGVYNMRPGMPGLALPWSDELLEKLNARYGGGALPYLAGLWYDLGPETPGIRFAYMDTVSALFRDNFSRHIGDWCRAHHVEYIGHIIEDMNAHARLGSSGGHYFRSLDGQDMAGIDIVLHQILPGFAHNTAGAAGSMYTDNEFYHYVLAKLGSSMAHLNPRVKNRALCEVFGAYGWAEGSPMMKWLMDHLLVRGVNRFVPHAFTPKYPDPDCPPHFGVEGHDPQFAGFTKLMGYVNRAVHLLEGAVHQADCAVLYHAEAEWMNGDNRMLTQKPARVLYDAHIDYDIVPLDSLYEAAAAANGGVRKGELVINRGHYRCLIVPGAPLLPEQALSALNALASSGLKVIYADQAPSGIWNPEIVPLETLAAKIAGLGFSGVQVDGFPLLRIGWWKRGGVRIFMLFNEDITNPVDTIVRFPCDGAYLKINLLDGFYSAGEGGAVPVKLTPYQSVIIAYGDDLPAPNYAEPAFTSSQPLNLKWDIALRATGGDPVETGFTPYLKDAELRNITGAGEKPDFSGHIRYTADFTVSDAARGAAQTAALDFGEVGEIISLKLNGKDCGLRICKPYVFDVSGLLKEGTNRIEAEVSNTLAQHVKDYFSFFIPIPPSGLLGPVVLLRGK